MSGENDDLRDLVLENREAIENLNDKLDAMAEERREAHADLLARIDAVAADRGPVAPDGGEGSDAR